MSYLPDSGTIVRLTDGRVAIVSAGTPDGSGDRVIFADGHD